VSGAAQPCVFTSAGLAFNYDVRNLYSLQMLDAAARVTLDGAAAPDAELLPPLPILMPILMIDGLPFSHASDTTRGVSQRNGYPDCDKGQDESGPEEVYALELTQATPLRILVFNRGSVDVDVHLLDESGVCLERNDKIIQRTLPAGRYQIVVDTFQSYAGPYLLVVVPCQAGDSSCS